MKEIKTLSKGDTIMEQITIVDEYGCVVSVEFIVKWYFDKWKDVTASFRFYFFRENYIPFNGRNNYNSFKEDITMLIVGTIILAMFVASEEIMGYIDEKEKAKKRR